MFQKLMRVGAATFDLAVARAGVIHFAGSVPNLKGSIHAYLSVDQARKVGQLFFDAADELEKILSTKDK